MAHWPTVYGSRATAEQVNIMIAIVNEGQRLKAPDISILAALYAAYGENTVSVNPYGGGLFQASCDNGVHYNYGSDWRSMLYAAYTGGTCFSYGGFIGAARYWHTIWQIANAVEENLVWSQTRGDSYARSFGTANLEAEVQNAFAYVNGAPADIIALARTEPATEPRPRFTGFTVSGVTLPPVTNRNWGPILRQIAERFSLHGVRATLNTEWARDIVEGTHYVDETGPRTIDGRRP